MKGYFLFFSFLLLFPIVLSIEECKGVMDQDELPCNNLLAVNTSLTNCSALTVDFFNNQSTLYETQVMSTFNPNFCNGTFDPGRNFTELVGTYTFGYSTGDTGSIIVEAGNVNFFNLSVYLIFSAIGLTFLVFMFVFQESANSSIVFGWLSTAINTILGSIILATDFTVITDVVLFIDADMYLATISFVLALYTATVSINLRKSTKVIDAHVW